MRMAQLEGQALAVPSVGRTTRVGLDSRAVAYADEEEGYRESFRYAGDGVGNERACRSPHLSLLLDGGVLHGHRHGVRLWIGDLDKRLERD